MSDPNIDTVSSPVAEARTLETARQTDPTDQLVEACDAVTFAWDALCEQVAQKANNGVLVPFSEDDRVIGLTIAEARTIRQALRRCRGES